MVRRYRQKSDRFKWEKSAMQNAIAAVKGGSTIRKAAREYSVPRSTLHRAIKGNVETGKRGGFSTVFTIEEEEEIVQHARKMPSLMHGLTPEKLKSLVYEFADLNNKKHPFSNVAKKAGQDWLNGFLRRHPELVPRIAENTSLNRITGFNKEKVQEFFDNLKSLMIEHEFEPGSIYNMDESGVSTVPNRSTTVLACKGVKQIGIVTSGEKGQTTTVVCAFNAVGHYIPPAVIFKRKNKAERLMRGAPPGSIQLISDSGWMTTEQFSIWLDHFARSTGASPSSRILLILDNHVSHCSMSNIIKAEELGIVILTIPPHTSHRLQPLDRTFFGPLKTLYHKECTNWQLTNPGKKLLRIMSLSCSERPTFEQHQLKKQSTDFGVPEFGLWIPTCSLRKTFWRQHM